VPAEIQNGVCRNIRAINANAISETYEDNGNGKTENSSISTTPLKFEDVPARNGLYYQKLELLTYIFPADSMGLHSLVFT